MVSVKESIRNYFKIDDPSTFKNEYNDPTVDRERRQRKYSKYDKFNFLNAFNWYPSYYSAYERKFLMKFDAFVLLFLCASFYTKYLDNTNVGSAYVSGLKQDLNLQGNELNYFNTCYTVGYALFQIPISLLITRPEFSRHLLLFCELAWGMMTLANAYVTTPGQMYAIRFFVGVFEACSFPATYVIFSSYLTDEELFKRAGVYGAFATAGSASSGALQSQAIRSLDGIFGMAGWRWQFIIDAVITFGVFLYGFFFFPGIPSSCKEFAFFTEDDMIFARKRLENKIAFPKKFTLASVKETLTTWQIYFGSALWVLHHIGWYSNGANLYMKSVPELYSATEVNTWNSYMYCIGIPSAIFMAPLAQYYGKIVPIHVILILAYYSCIVLIIWEVPNAMLISAFFLEQPFLSGLAQLYYSWVATLCKDNVEKKALVLSWIQALSYAINAFSIPLQYPVSEAPRFKKGYRINIGLIAGSHMVFIIGLILEKYDLRICPRFAGNRHTDNSGILLTAKDADDESTIEHASDDFERYEVKNESGVTGLKIDEFALPDEESI
jgi:ACS family pantothenate transporter-like MFS transporter